MKQTVIRLYGLLVRAACSLQTPFLLAIRLYWGWQMALTGWGKIGNMSHVIEFFTSLGIPAPSLNAHFIALLEFVGGILFAVGLGSRLIALLFAGDMLVAFWLADREALLSIFSDTGKFWAATPFTFLFASLIILIFGPGKWAVDEVIKKKTEVRNQKSE
jgi:putative oxidoreductase